MDSNNPYFLSKNDLLQKLRENGYEELSEILKHKDVDGSKLVRLKQIEVVSWGLSHSQTETLFDFIEKFKRNPAILKSKPKPETPIKVEISSSMKPAIIPKPKGLPHKGFNTLSPFSSQNSKLNPNPTSGSSTNTLPKKLPVPSPNAERKNENTFKPVQKFDPLPPLPDPNMRTGGNKSTMDVISSDDSEYIDMQPPDCRVNRFLFKQKAFALPELAKFEKSSTHIPPCTPIRSKDLSPIKSNSERNISNKLVLEKEKCENRTIDSPGNSSVVNRTPVQGVRNPNIVIIKPFKKTNSKPTVDSKPSGNSDDDVYEDPDVVELPKKRIFMLPNKIPLLNLPVNRGPIPLPVEDSVDSSGRTGNKTPVSKNPENKSENVNFLPQDVYEPVEDGNTVNSKNINLEFRDPIHIEPEDTDEECENNNTYEKLPKSNVTNKENRRGLSKFFSKFMPACKSREVSHARGELYENVTPKENQATTPKYNPTYIKRPLPEPPTTQLSLMSVANDLPKSPSPVNVTPNPEKNLDDEEAYLKPIEVSVTSDRPDNVKIENQENPPGPLNQPSSKQCEKTRKTSPKHVITLAEELQKRLAERSLGKNKILNTESTDEEELEPDPVYENKEDQQRASKPINYVTHFIPQLVRAAIPKYSDNNEDIYVQVASNVTNNPFFRETCKDGVRRYLENLEDGAFLFRRGNTCPLVLAVKYENRYYQMQIEKTRDNTFRLVEEDDNYTPEFSNLNEFVEYFTKEPITFKSGQQIIEIILKPVLPITRRF